MDWPSPEEPLTRPALAHAAALTRVLQLARRLGRALQARRIEVAPFVLGRWSVSRATVPAAFSSRLRGRQGQRWPLAFTLGALDAEEPRHSPRASRAAPAARIRSRAKARDSELSPRDLSRRSEQLRRRDTRLLLLGDGSSGGPRPACRPRIGQDDRDIIDTRSVIARTGSGGGSPWVGGR